jgi:hypothetical protein
MSSSWPGRGDCHDPHRATPRPHPLATQPKPEGTANLPQAASGGFQARARSMRSTCGSAMADREAAARLARAHRDGRVPSAQTWPRGTASSHGIDPVSRAPWRRGAGDRDGGAVYRRVRTASVARYAGTRRDARPHQTRFRADCQGRGGARGANAHKPARTAGKSCHNHVGKAKGLHSGIRDRELRQCHDEGRGLPTAHRGYDADGDARCAMIRTFGKKAPPRQHACAGREQLRGAMRKTGRGRGLCAPATTRMPRMRQEGRTHRSRPRRHARLPLAAHGQDRPCSGVMMSRSRAFRHDRAMFAEDPDSNVQDADATTRTERDEGHPVEADRSAPRVTTRSRRPGDRSTVTRQLHIVPQPHSSDLPQPSPTGERQLCGAAPHRRQHGDHSRGRRLPSPAAKPGGRGAAPAERFG